jgi:cytochrome P450
MTTSNEDLYYDPYDKTLDLDPYPVWRRMRDERPVYRNEVYDFFALSRHADVQAAHVDPRTYSSAYGHVLEMMQDEPYSVPVLVMEDPPRHEIHRSLLSRAFTPRRVSAIEPRIRAVCADLLDPFRGSGGFDYVQDFAALVPSKVISELIGVEPDDREEVRKLIDLCVHIEEGVGIVNPTSRGASRNLHSYFCDQIERRRRAPEDDLMTALAEAEVELDGERRHLTTEEAAYLIQELTGGGTETVARLLGWACALLYSHPEQRADLVGDPSLLPNAIEETLRYQAPSAVQGRRVTKDVALHGVDIPAGSKVLLLTGSAGRDERKYVDPDRYDIRRRLDSHISFGHGIHFCIGAALARLEARVALEETLSRFPTWEVDHDNEVRLHTSTIRGYERLPIRV